MNVQKLKKQIVRAVKKPLYDTWVSRYFNRKYGLLNGVKNTIKLHFEGYGVYVCYEQPIDAILIKNFENFEITDIKAKKSKDTLYIMIELVKIGMIIGKGERTIDGLKESLKKRFNCNVEIYMVEQNYGVIKDFNSNLLSQSNV